MLVDLHAHYPMHLLDDEEQRTHERVKDFSRRRLQAKIVDLISTFANYQGPSGGPSVTEELMRAGEVGAVLSVLYAPFDEIDLDKSYGAPPDGSYADDILAQLETVEKHVRRHSRRVGVAHSPAELDALIAKGRIAVIHAIEGGLFLGPCEPAIRANVQKLAHRGVAYVTVAHLFWRAVATNAPALPFLPDWLYHLAFRQPHVGLSPLGEVAVDAMLDEGIIVDITHMSERAIKDTFAIYDRRDPQRRIPLLATHMACRFGGLEYSFTDDTIRQVADRGGVLGCILCEHYITSGLGKVSSFPESFDALCKHIDRIHEATNSFDFVGIGSDLDGYIKPALPGLQHMGRMKRLQDALAGRYGSVNAAKICHENALRVLRAAWKGRP